MRKIVLTYGLISGAIAGGMFLITIPFWESGALNFDNGEIVGYTTMVVALSLVFFGVRSYRDNHQQGTITFGRGVKVGILISLIAAAMYAAGWEISYQTVNKDFMANYTAHYLEKMEQEGASAEEISEMESQMAMYGEWYKNPIIRFGMSAMEIIPVGLLVTVVSAALLRRRDGTPGTA